MPPGSGSTAFDANCEEFQPDLVSLYDGTPGIDNAYSALVPTIEGLTGQSLDVRLAEAIATGEALLLIELIGSPPAQMLVELGATSAPLELEPDGTLSPGQTFFAFETVSATLFEIA